MNETHRVSLEELEKKQLRVGKNSEKKKKCYCQRNGFGLKNALKAVQQGHLAKAPSCQSPEDKVVGRGGVRGRELSPL